MSVVGFDFGNQTCKVGVARRRGIDVLQNEVGHRSTPTQVAFAGKQRLVGNEAQAQAGSNAKNTIINVKALLGHYYSENEDLKYEQQATPNKLVAVPNPREPSVLPPKVGYEVQYTDEQQTFTPEQITAAVFTKLKSIASEGLDGINITDCVIGCPSWWTQGQRQALLDSANIAGLNVLRIMNETTAIALNYGILKPLTKDQTQRVMFVDMGHHNTNVAIVAFTEGKLTVEGTSSDRRLGGRNFDDLLVHHFAQYTKTKYKLDPFTNAKAMVKLRKECERIKLMLSSNMKVPFNIEYFMNDTDVKGMIERPEFEEMIKTSLLPRIHGVLDEALKNAGKQKADLTSVEIVGGTVRIPIVQQQLKDWFVGGDLRKTCDTEESVARGCALMCAMLSPSFKVKDFETHDVYSYPIDVEWGAAGNSTLSLKQLDLQPLEDKSQLFQAFCTVPSTKLISFNDRQEPFQLQANYNDAAKIPAGMLKQIGRFLVKGMPPKSEGKAPKIKVRVRLDANGIIQVANAELIEELPETAAVAPTAAAAAPAASASPEVEMNNSSDDTGSRPESAASGEAQKMETEANSAAPNGDAAAAAAPAKKAVKVKRSYLTVDTLYFVGLPAETLQAFFDKEAAMIHQDKVIAETNQARNDLEAYVLDSRNRLSGDLAEYSTESERKSLNDECDAQENWLYDEGLDASRSQYRTKLEGLKKIGDPIYNRKHEADSRAEAIAALQQSTQHYQQWAANTSDEKYAHISAEDRKKVSDYVNQAETWLQGAQAEFARLKPTDNPTTTANQIIQKKFEVEKFVHPIVSKAKPRPTPPPKTETPKPESKPTTPAPETDAKTSADANSKQAEGKTEEAKQAEKPMDTSS